jgi:perosamine synthetase
MIPIARPLMGDAEAAAARRVISSGWITQGPEVAAFEREFAEYVGSDYACAVSNCTTALHLALLAAGVGPGDEVVTVSHSFIATANSIRYCGAIPIFVDIDPRTFNMDPALVDTAITPRTKAILCVHQMGMPCDMSALLTIAQRYAIPLIEDAACSIGSEILWNGRWEKIGKPHGDAACFSFHPRKVITTGDGGMITTRHKSWDARFRLLRQHAMSVPDTVRHGSSEVIFEQYTTVGFNYRMTDIQAAIGREQLKRLPHFILERRKLADRYQDLLGGIEGLELPHEPTWARSNWQSYCVRLPQGVQQKDLMQAMLTEGISTRRGIMCSHREQAYRGPEFTRSTLKQSEDAQDRCVVLPLFCDLTEGEQSKVAAMLQTILFEQRRSAKRDQTASAT